MAIEHIFLTKKNSERLAQNYSDYFNALKNTLDALNYKTLNDYNDAVKNSKNATHATFICYTFNVEYYKNVDSKYKN